MLSRGVHQRPQRLDKPLAVRILAHQLGPVAVHAVDRSGQLGGGRQLIQKGQHRDLVGNREIGAAKPHRPQPADGVPEVLRGHLQSQVPPIQPGCGKSPLHDELGRVAGHRLTQATDDLLKRRVGHELHLLETLNDGAIVKCQAVPCNGRTPIGAKKSPFFLGPPQAGRAAAPFPGPGGQKILAL